MRRFTLCTINFKITANHEIWLLWKSSARRDLFNRCDSSGRLFRCSPAFCPPAINASI